MAEWGVPDWRNGDSYPDPASTTLREWWWEFTRRRPDYRAAWEAAGPTNEAGRRYAPDVDAWRVKFQLSLIYNPAEQFDDWALFHMHYPLNGGSTPRALNRESLDLHNAREVAEAEGGLYRYSFDLRKPLRTQLATAERLLRSVKSELYPDAKDRRKRVGKWREYLRVLDARDAGATFVEIADVLDPQEVQEPQWAFAKYEAARDLRDNFPI